MATLKPSRFRILAAPLLVTGLLLSGYGCDAQHPSVTAPTPIAAPAKTEAAKPTPAEPPASEAETSPPDETPAVGSSTADPQAAEAETEQASEEAIASPSESIAQRLAIAGIEDPQAAKDFIAQMNTAATNEDADAIANLIHYPFTTYNLGEPLKTYTTPAELLTDFDQIVTPAVLAAMSQANYDDLFANDQGAMIGNGTVWFNPFDEGLKIQAINS
jgi:hypothetical protein